MVYRIVHFDFFLVCVCTGLGLSTALEAKHNLLVYLDLHARRKVLRIGGG